jgi:DnaJ-like protein
MRLVEAAVRWWHRYRAGGPVRRRGGPRRQAAPLPPEPDHYAVLRVGPEALPGEIERSYRRLAGQRTNAAWRPGRAARELAQINAAYGVLGYPDRRADYDRRRAAQLLAAAEGRQNGASRGEIEPALLSYRPPGRRQLPRVQIGRPTGGTSLDGVIILLVVVLSLFVGSLFASRNLIDLSFISNVGESIGLTPRRRLTATPSPASTAVLAAAPSPGAALTPTPAEPPGALPTAVSGQRFAGSELVVSDPRPARRTDLTLTLKLVREGKPVPNANLYATVHYRTVDERQPPGTATVRTDDTGTATIKFNIGDATANYQVNVDVTALVEGQQVAFQTSFNPR